MHHSIATHMGREDDRICKQLFGGNVLITRKNLNVASLRAAALKIAGQPFNHCSKREPSEALRSVAFMVAWEDKDLFVAVKAYLDNVRYSNSEQRFYTKLMNALAKPQSATSK